MKKMETKFYCDDCGKPLPKPFVRGEGEKTEFALGEYNTVRKLCSMQTDSSHLRINVGLKVETPYSPAYTELCPSCRLKWMKAALGEFEQAAQFYEEDMKRIYPDDYPDDPEGDKEDDGNDGKK